MQTLFVFFDHYFIGLQRVSKETTQAILQWVGMIGPEDNGAVAKRNAPVASIQQAVQRIGVSKGSVLADGRIVALRFAIRAIGSFIEGY